MGTPLTTTTATKLRSPTRVRHSTLKSRPTSHPLSHTSSLSPSTRHQNQSTSQLLPTNQLPPTSPPQLLPSRGLNHHIPHQHHPTVKQTSVYISHYLNVPHI